MAIIFASILIIVGLLLGMYIQNVFAMAAIILVAMLGYKSSFLLTYGFGIINTLVLLCVPLFIAVGLLMEKSGIGKHLINFVDLFVGRFKSGLAIVCILASGAFGSISGSAFATLSCIGSIMKPRFKERGYPEEFSAALVTCSSPLGLLIPPSAHMVLYSWAGRQSMLACFLATVVPGCILMLLMSVTCYFILRNNNDVITREKLPLNEFIKTAAERTTTTIPALVMPVIVLGGIYSGVFTPTEAAAVSVIYSLPVGFGVYKGLTKNKLKESIVDSATSVGAIMSMIVFCLMLSQTFIFLRVPQAIIKIMFGLTENRVVLLILINLLLFLIGMIVNDVTGMVLAAPMLLPLVIELGISPIQFAAIMGVNLAMGGVTPPYASLLYLGMRIGKVEFLDILKPAMTFLCLGYLPVVFLTTFWPDLSLFLPKLAGYIH